MFFMFSNILNKFRQTHITTLVGIGVLNKFLKKEKEKQKNYFHKEIGIEIRRIEEIIMERNVC